MNPTTNAPTTDAAEPALNVEQFPGQPTQGDDPPVDPEFMKQMAEGFIKAPKVQSAMVHAAFQTKILDGITGGSVSLDKILNQFEKWAKIEGPLNPDYYTSTAETSKQSDTE